MSVNPSKITIREISKKIAKDMIVKNHYSHKWTSCRYALGIFYEMDGSLEDAKKCYEIQTQVSKSDVVGWLKENSNDLSPILKDALEYTLENVKDFWQYKIEEIDRQIRMNEQKLLIKKIIDKIIIINIFFFSYIIIIFY